MKILSLFSNIGVAEAYLDRIGMDVVVANEFIERRAKLYSKIYPETEMVCGDIQDEIIRTRIIESSIQKGVDIIMATPPCQGMSTAGQQLEDDERNRLVLNVIDVIEKINPKYVFIENVPLFLKTKISYDGDKVLIPDILNLRLGKKYIINYNLIDTSNYSVPQTRERVIILMTRKTESKVWTIPEKDDKKVTMRDAIGALPKLDPFITDVDEEELLDIFPDFYARKKNALEISPWHQPPKHIKRQVIAMQHTPTGCTAFDNEKYFPVKADGTAVKGYHNTYKRQNWDMPAYTITMDNRKISSQNNVHPGRLEIVDKNGEKIYSDARTLTVYEIMRLMSIPEDWPVPLNTPEAFLRRIIGEGIPSLFVKKVFENI